MDKRERLIAAIFTAVFTGLFSWGETDTASFPYASETIFFFPRFSDSDVRTGVFARRIKPLFYGGGE